MADSPEAILLKRQARRRLVGAIALVAVVVIVLPLVLDRQPRTVTRPLTLRIPSLDGQTSSEPAPSPVGSAAPRAARANPENPSANSNSRARTHNRKGGRNEEPQGAKARETEARRDAYVVPLGAFTHADNAKQVREKATSAGIKSYTETIKVPQGESTRVRAGPFASRDSAEKAREKLKSLGVEVGQVLQK